MENMKRRGNNIRIPAGTLTGRILAATVGVSEDTVIRWRKASLLPYSTEKHGSLTVYLFGADAVERARQLASGTGRLKGRGEKAA